MSITPPKDDAAAGATSAVAATTTLLPQPGHHLLDNIEVAAMDEVQHEAALRASAVRMPR
jgi:hypothetical protein